MPESTKAQIKASVKYDANNTTRLYIKLNNNTDADIIEHLKSVANKQGYIKELMRDDMNDSFRWIPCAEKPPEEPCIYTIKDESPYVIRTKGKPSYRISFHKEYLEMFQSVIAWMPLKPYNEE